MGELPQPMLRVDHERSADAHVIRLVGEMDLGNVDEARAALMSVSTATTSTSSWT